MSRPIARAALRSTSSNGSAIFIPQIRRLVFEYCDVFATSSRTRSYIFKHIEQLARDNPHVEIVIRQRTGRPPIIRGLYLNGRDKVIELTNLEPLSIQQKVQLLLDSSGAPIKPLKTLS
ncbi:thioredoxin-like protein [Auriculariales sp. MPI-PUGE-AT-0066]|nr:thioredoxin-like protein [Auriculariales sp. MPI-PUGE-AT-0066]